MGAPPFFAQAAGSRAGLRLVRWCTKGCFSRWPSLRRSPRLSPPVCSSRPISIFAVMPQPQQFGQCGPSRSLFVADLLDFDRAGEPACAPRAERTPTLASIWQVPVVKDGWVPGLGQRWTPAHQLMFNMGEDPLLREALGPGKALLGVGVFLPLPPALAEFSELQAWMAPAAPLTCNQATPWENPSCTWSHQSSSTASSMPSSSSAAPPPLAHSCVALRPA